MAPTFGSVGRPRRHPCVTYTLTLLLLAPVEIYALELGEASIKNALGESLLVEIPYRLADNERLTPACVKLVPARSRDALPTYTRAARVTISSTTIEIFDNERVVEPLIGLAIAIDCSTAPHFARTYELLVDLPAETPVLSSARTEVAATPGRSVTETAGPVAGTRRVPTSVVASGTTTVAAADRAASAPVARTVRAHASARASGHAGGNVTQGQTYRVVRGDTLSGIATRIADRPATVSETSEAIFAANPNAFTHGNRDLIEEGRSIVIPILTRATATALAAAPTPATTATVPAPRAEESTDILAPGATEPPPADVTPVAVAVAEPIVASTPIELAPGAESGTSARRSPWLTSLLVLGVGVVLSAPLVIMRGRRRLQTAPPKTREDVPKRHTRRLATPLAGREVIEPRTAETPADKKTAPRRNTAVEPVADHFVAVVPKLDEPARPIRSMDGERVPMTKLDVPHQDYEVEHTLTEQLSPELRNAIADLQATKAREASKARSLLQSDDTETWADSTAVRIRK